MGILIVESGVVDSELVGVGSGLVVVTGMHGIGVADSESVGVGSGLMVVTVTDALGISDSESVGVSSGLMVVTGMDGIGVANLSSLSEGLGSVGGIILVLPSVVCDVGVTVKGTLCGLAWPAGLPQDVDVMVSKSPTAIKPAIHRASEPRN